MWWEGGGRVRAWKVLGDTAAARRKKGRRRVMGVIDGNNMNNA